MLESAWEDVKRALKEETSIRVSHSKSFEVKQPRFSDLLAKTLQTLKRHAQHQTSILLDCLNVIKDLSAQSVASKMVGDQLLERPSIRFPILGRLI